MWGVGCWMRGVGCRVLDAGCRMWDVGFTGRMGKGIDDGGS